MSSELKARSQIRREWVADANMFKFKNIVKVFKAYDHRVMSALKCIHFVLAGLDKEWNDKHIFVAIYLRTLDQFLSSTNGSASTNIH